MPVQTNIKISVAILMNLRSGKGKAVAIGNKISELLSSRNIVFEMFAEHWPEDLSIFSEAWIIGGDGTINYFVNRYPGIQIPLVLFKGGTGNDFSWKLYGDISIEEQVELVLNADPKPIDALTCNGQLYVNSLGVGFDGEVLSSMKAVRWLGGHLGYLSVVIRKIFSFKEPSYKIAFADRVLNERFLLVIVNNNSRTGGGFLVAPKAEINDGLADVVLCKRLSIAKRLRSLPIIEKGKHLEKDFIIFSQRTQVKIECEREIVASLDGELIKAREFEIKVLPGLLQFKY